MGFSDRSSTFPDMRDRCYFSDERRSGKAAKFLEQVTVLGWFAPQLCSKIFKAWRNRGEALLDFSAIYQGETAKPNADLLNCLETN